MNKIPLFLLALLIAALPALAVTDQEMEEARTITALTYLRYANDGSGYLDSHHPKTMAELKKILNKTETENLKAFEKIANPKNYSSWGKDELVEYWGTTFYNSPGLLEKGKIGKARTVKRLKAMNVAAPSQKAAKADESSKEAAKKETETPQSNETAMQDAPVPAELAGEASEPLPLPEEDPAARQLALQADSLALAEQALLADAEEELPVKKENHTWLYILILAVIVVVVVWLVVYASNVLKADNRRRQAADAEAGRFATKAGAAKAGEAGMRKDFSEKLAEKNREIARLEREFQSMRERCDQAERRLQEADDTIASLQSEVERLAAATTSAGMTAAAAAAAATVATPTATERASGEQAASREAAGEEAHVSASVAAAPVRRTIYLGRVNQRGQFVRADRNVNPEASVYMLETQDGYSGTFRVLQSSDIDRRLLERPVEWLHAGCTWDQEAIPADARRVHTEVSGTAIYEGGAWRVIRKARIRFGQ